MIISKKLRFCFIKTHKTAGTSLEIALSRFCGPGDIITPMGGDDEDLRLASGGRPAQNYKLPLSRLVGRGLISAVRARYWPRLWNHAPLGEAVKFCQFPGFPDDYFVFALERDPFEKVKSFYFHMRRKGFTGSLDDFCQIQNLKRICDFDLYSAPDGRVQAHIFHYEDLPMILRDIEERLGIGRIELPKAKSGFRTSEAFEFRPEEIERVRYVFSREFATFPRYGAASCYHFGGER